MVVGTRSRRACFAFAAFSGKPVMRIMSPGETVGTSSPFSPFTCSTGFSSTVKFEENLYFISKILISLLNNYLTSG